MDINQKDDHATPSADKKSENKIDGFTDEQTHSIEPESPIEVPDSGKDVPANGNKTITAGTHDNLKEKEYPITSGL